MGLNEKERGGEWCFGSCVGLGSVCTGACCKCEVHEYEFPEGSAEDGKECACCIIELLWFAVLNSSPGCYANEDMHNIHCCAIEYIFST